MARGKKTGGRTKGTPNKANAKTREEIWDYCATIGTNPFLVMADLLGDDDKKLRLDAAKALSPYLLAPLQRQELVLTPPEAQAQIAALLGLDGDAFS